MNRWTPGYVGQSQNRTNRSYSSPTLIDIYETYFGIECLNKSERFAFLYGKKIKSTKERQYEFPFS